MKRERIALWLIAIFGTTIAALDLAYFRLYEAALQAAICGFVAGLAICLAKKQDDKERDRHETTKRPMD